MCRPDRCADLPTEARQASLLAPNTAPMFFLQRVEDYARAFAAAKAAADALRNEPDEGPENLYGVCVSPVGNEVKTEVIERALQMAAVSYSLGLDFGDDDIFLLHLTHGKASLRERTADVVQDVLESHAVAVETHFGQHDSTWRPKPGDGNS